MSKITNRAKLFESTPNSKKSTQDNQNIVQIKKNDIKLDKNNKDLKNQKLPDKKKNLTSIFEGKAESIKDNNNQPYPKNNIQINQLKKKFEPENKLKRSNDMIPLKNNIPSKAPVKINKNKKFLDKVNEGLLKFDKGKNPNTFTFKDHNIYRKTICKNIKGKDDEALSKVLGNILVSVDESNEFEDLSQSFEVHLKSTPTENTKDDTFCMSFFLASFNINNPKILKSTNVFDADCGHKNCSSLLGVSPEIIFKYPTENSDFFELSDLNASLCFPNSIKICIGQNEDELKPLPNYFCTLTNQDGQRYYMITNHFYTRCKYDENLIKKLDEKKIITNKYNYMYIPHCFCLLSKYPFFYQINKCLMSIRAAFDNKGKNEIVHLIQCFTKSIPIPPINEKLSFQIPYCPSVIEITQPNYKDILIEGGNPCSLFEYLSVEEVTTIFRLLILEQKLILVENNYEILTQITFNFLTILYPLQFVNTYISIITEKMIKYLQSFLPFFYGMHSSLYELSQNILASSDQTIYIFDGSRHIFEVNKNYSLNSKNVLKQINTTIPKFPKDIFNKLYSKLGKVKSSYASKKKENKLRDLNIKMKFYFIRFFNEILHNYKTYLSDIAGKPIFNSNGFLEKVPKNDQAFYKEFTETQLFQMFIQNNPVNVVGEKKNSFFSEQLEKYEKLDKKKYKVDFFNTYKSLFDIRRNYIINPICFGNNKNNNTTATPNNNKKAELKESKKQETKNDKFEEKKSPYILTTPIDLELDYFPKKIDYYKIPFNKKNDVVKKDEIKKNGISKQDNLTQERKDEIKDNIIDSLTMILKNEDLDDINEKEFQKSISNNYGRQLFLDILCNNNNIINENSFNKLYNLIYICYDNILQIEDNDKRLESCVQIIKCCQNFGKEEGKKHIKYISDVIYPKMAMSTVVQDIKFWRSWTIYDITRENNLSLIEKWNNSVNSMKISMDKMELDEDLKKNLFGGFINQDDLQKLKSEINSNQV